MTCLREAGSFAPAFAKPASAGEGRSAKAGWRLLWLVAPELLGGLMQLEPLADR